MIKDCLDCHVLKQMWKYIQRLFWNSISNLVLRFLLCLVYVCVDDVQIAFENRYPSRTIMCIFGTTYEHV